jgi:hypothetical protein
MSPLNRLSPQDLERLSAYIDRRLPAADSSRLELRLAREPQLREALEELRWTTGLLRSLPSLPTPRSFALKPEAVTRRQAARWYPTLQLGTALAGIAFLAVVGLDVFTSRVASLAARAPAPAAEDASLEAPAEVGAELFAAQAAETPTPMGTGVPESEYRMAATGTEEPPSLALAAPTLYPTDAKAQPVETAQADAGLPSEPGLSLADQVEPTAAPAGQQTLLPIEIALGALTVVLGALTLRFRRRSMG